MSLFNGVGAAAGRVRRLCALALAWALALGAGQGAWGHSADGAPVALPPVPAMPDIQSMVTESRTESLAGSTGGQDPNAIRVLLSPELETTLAAQMAGRIAEVTVGLGAHVEQDSVLLRFDCAETDARLAMAQAESAAARENLSVRQRLRKLDAAGDSEVLLARIEARKHAAAVELAQVQQTYCEVRAPFTGRVVRLHVKPHQSVNQGTPLLELVSDGTLKLRMNVPSRLLRAVQVGTAVEVDILETGRSYAAEVSAINARVDAVAQTIELEARLVDATPDLLPGMSGVARFAP